MSQIYKPLLALAAIFAFTELANAEDDFDFMQSFDKDQDSKVSLEEFMEYLGANKEITKAFTEEQWKESGNLAFQVYDLDNNKQLDSE